MATAQYQTVGDLAARGRTAEPLQFGGLAEYRHLESVTLRGTHRYAVAVEGFRHGLLARKSPLRLKQPGAAGNMPRARGKAGILRG
jgi:hypothetical protein